MAEIKAKSVEPVPVANSSAQTNHSSTSNQTLANQTSTAQKSREEKRATVTVTKTLSSGQVVKEVHENNSTSQSAASKKVKVDLNKLVGTQNHTIAIATQAHI